MAAKHPAWCHRTSSGRALLGLVGLRDQTTSITLRLLLDCGESWAKASQPCGSVAHPHTPPVTSWDSSEE